MAAKYKTGRYVFILRHQRYRFAAESETCNFFRLGVQRIQCRPPLVLLAPLFTHARYARNGYPRSPLLPESRDNCGGTPYLLTTSSGPSDASHGVDQRIRWRHQLCHISLSPVLINTDAPPSPLRASVPITSSASTPETASRGVTLWLLTMACGRLYLRTQIIRHRRTMRFVMFKELITEGFSSLASNNTTAACVG